MKIYFNQIILGLLVFLLTGCAKEDAKYSCLAEDGNRTSLVISSNTAKMDYSELVLCEETGNILRYSYSKKECDGFPTSYTDVIFDPIIESLTVTSKTNGETKYFIKSKCSKVD
jgi:hypothetical protein